jgi:hypothetical protein
MTPEARPEVYRLHVCIRQIGPMNWRRLLVRSDSTIADLHYTLQIAFGWTDAHLNLFHIHGEDYGVRHDGGMSFSTDPKQVRLGDFHFRINERFRYEYDFGAGWEHQVRLEARLPVDDRITYPRCVSGARRCPPEDCGGPLRFMARRDAIPGQLRELLCDIREDLAAKDPEAIRERLESFEDLREWLTLDEFDRRTVNRRLKQYATHDPSWKWEEVIQFRGVRHESAPTDDH